MTKNTWNRFVEARYAGLVKAASTVVGRANAADAVLGALLRAATTKTYLDCKIDPFTWVISTVTIGRRKQPARREDTSRRGRIVRATKSQA
jgi:hypothetical protein